MKASRYGKLDRPFGVALSCQNPFLKNYDALVALFGEDANQEGAAPYQERCHAPKALLRQRSEHNQLVETRSRAFEKMTQPWPWSLTDGAGDARSFNGQVQGGRLCGLVSGGYVRLSCAFITARRITCAYWCA